MGQVLVSIMLRLSIPSGELLPSTHPDKAVLEAISVKYWSRCQRAIRGLDRLLPTFTVKSMIFPRQDSNEGISVGNLSPVVQF